MTNKDPELLPKLWRLHERGLSYASDTPAVNLLLADMAEGVKLAAEAIAAWNTRTALLPCQVSDAMLNAAREAGPPILRGVADCELTEILEAALSTASTIPTDGDAARLLQNALDDIQFGMKFAYEQGLHEFGYDPEAVVRAALSTIPSAGDGDDEESAWTWLINYCDKRHNEHPSDRAYSADEMVDAFMAGRAALSIQTISGKGMREALDPDVRRRLESVAKTLETCGKHGIPIDFAMLAHDIRAALVDQDERG